MIARMPTAVTDGRGATWLVALILLSFPTVGLLAKHGMSTLAITLSMLMAGIMLAGRRMPWPGWALAAPAVGLLALHLLDLLIAPACPPCAESWPRTAGALLVLLPLAAGGLATATALDRRTAGRALVAGVVIGIVVAAVELGLDAPIYRFFDGRAPGSFVSMSRFNRGLVALALLSVVAGGWLWTRGRRRPAAGVLMAVGAVAALGDSLTAQLCVLLAVLSLAVSAVAERLVRTALVIVVAAQMLSAPWLAPAAYDWADGRDLKMDPAIRHRLELWDHGAALAQARPWTGWGLDAFDHLPIAPERLARARKMTHPEPHPHNAGLQLWVETGIFGVLLGIAFLAAMAWRIGRMAPELRPWGTALLAVAVAPGLVSFGIWQVTYLAMSALAAFAFSLLRADPVLGDRLVKPHPDS
ncbi:MAG: O-antigen ligase family protein [Thalassobaculaceae bacterium]|nr:O-antigen ligase family protein [Thalassobaculaceae bacterium]